MDCPVKIQKVEYPECIVSKGADVLAVQYTTGKHSMTYSIQTQ